MGESNQNAKAKDPKNERCNSCSSLIFAEELVLTILLRVEVRECQNAHQKVEGGQENGNS